MSVLLTACGDLSSKSSSQKDISQPLIKSISMVSQQMIYLFTVNSENFASVLFSFVKIHLSRNGEIFEQKYMLGLL